MLIFTIFLAIAILAVSVSLFFRPKRSRLLLNIALFFTLLLLVKTQWQELKGDEQIVSPIKQSLLSEKTSPETFSGQSSVLLDVPIIRQLPELPRGCEVTSLAMLLQYAGVDVDKMTLAKQVKKDPTPYQKKNGQTYFGHPNVGFVGDMYSLKNPGLGVYHKPIRQLAEMYLPNRIIDLTGSDFEKLQQYLSNGSPVWVITNATYKKLPKSAFRQWQTPHGAIEITYYEHSVVVTGYNEQFVYFNDPLSGEKNKKAPKSEFIDAWVQMGRQAITIKPQ
jgi:uncharacterized protein YvpB